MNNRAKLIWKKHLDELAKKHRKAIYLHRDCQPYARYKSLAEYWDKRCNVIYQKFHKIELLLKEKND